MCVCVPACTSARAPLSRPLLRSIFPETGVFICPVALLSVSDRRTHSRGTVIVTLRNVLCTQCIVNGVCCQVQRFSAQTFPDILWDRLCTVYTMPVSICQHKYDGTGGASPKGTTAATRAIKCRCKRKQACWFYTGLELINKHRFHPWHHNRFFLGFGCFLL